MSAVFRVRRREQMIVALYLDRHGICRTDQ
jgi:hypothetical protein